MMTHDDKLAHISKAIGCRSLSWYRKMACHLFKGVSLEGKAVLEVGCGRGTYALWAAVHGAKSVLGIEPEAHGSTEGTLGTFRKLVDELDLSPTVEARDAILDQLTPADGPFDIVVMYNVINHLDESAVRTLGEDEQSVASYQRILAHLRSILSDDAVVIIADCARSNFWGSLGLRSPFAPTIGWELHQDPSLWKRVFRAAGFEYTSLSWSPLYPLGFLASIGLVHYFTCSHFVLKFKTAN